MSTDVFAMLAKPVYLKPETVQVGVRITQLFPKVQIGGSYLVLGYGAQDLDLFMDWNTWLEVLAWINKQGHEVVYKNHKLSDYEHDAGHALLTVADLGQLQFIVVKDQYLPAYQKCAEIMNRDPQIFQDKADRVALYRILRYLAQQETELV